MTGQHFFSSPANIIIIVKLLKIVLWSIWDPVLLVFLILFNRGYCNSGNWLLEVVELTTPNFTPNWSWHLKIGSNAVWHSWLGLISFWKLWSYGDSCSMTCYISMAFLVNLELRQKLSSKSGKCFLCRIFQCICIRNQIALHSKLLFHLHTTCWK